MKTLNLAEQALAERQVKWLNSWRTRNAPHLLVVLYVLCLVALVAYALLWLAFIQQADSAGVQLSEAVSSRPLDESEITRERVALRDSLCWLRFITIAILVVVCGVVVVRASVLESRVLAKLAARLKELGEL